MSPFLDQAAALPQYFENESPEVALALSSVAKEYPPVNLEPTDKAERETILQTYLIADQVLPVNITTQLLFDNFEKIKSITRAENLKLSSIELCLVIPQLFLLFLDEYKRFLIIDYLNDREDLRDASKKKTANTIIKTTKAYYEIMMKNGQITIPQLLQISESKTLD